MLWLLLGINIIIITAVQGQLNFNNDLENNQKFQSVPTTIKTYENDTVLLPCSLDTPFRYVRWHRDDVPLVDSRHPEILPPDRVMLWPNGSLQVSYVQTEDTGDYYCEIMSATGIRSIQVHAIEVQYPASVLIEPNGVTEQSIGSVVEVACQAQGVPQPVITWRLNGNTLDRYSRTGNRQSHIFDIKSRSMAGQIECVATNGVGQPAVAGVYLQVLFIPEVSLPQTIVYTKVGARAHLECLVESAPMAAVKWFHHGLLITMGSQITTHETELQFNRSVDHYVSHIKHVLVIKKVRDADMGQYECRAYNKLGFKSASIELTGRPMPCIFKINPGTQSPTSHILVWQTESLLPIMEFKLKFRQIPSRNVTKQIRTNWTELTIPAQVTIGSIYITSYTLHGLQPASLFEVSVLARNSFGWSDNSKIVRFATGGEVELPNYSTESEMQYDATEEYSEQNEITQRSQILTASMTHNRAEALSNCGPSALIYSIVLIIKLFYVNFKNLY
ncbi:uncharacterized protein Dwil_GK20814 [Drosophila willistoni]|uniref:Opioid-binding protein/cell adhesion molecule n=1 Tax=Drosophila willistoni TaxID=7260 RepID=B4MJG7_DROWI|nr:opioid-binding protein/cell adhesion molecule [Drosophila willistoni]EDW72256.1 uncharacterized protein Dwil_GK20814 [Drosophila willistoni]